MRRFKFSMQEPRSTLISATMLLFAALTVTVAGNAQGPTETVRLPGHVLELLPSAARLPRDPQAATEQMILTIVLNRSDPGGFEAFRSAFQDPASPTYHQAIGAGDLAARFGPTQQAYDATLAYLQQNGFELVAGSENRIAITVRGTRAQVEHAFGLSIDDYQLGTRQFHANDKDPAFPVTLAPMIHGVSGLANLARPHPANAPSPASPVSFGAAYNGTVTASGTTTGGLPPGITGAGQTVGLIEYDNYLTSNLVNGLNAMGMPASLINQVSTRNVAGGTTPGPGQNEVLADIEAVLGMAPGANVVVFDAYWKNIDFISMINIASQSLSQTNGRRGGILSQSWSQCESEISNADADNMEATLQGFIFTGLSFFISSGDNGSTCVNVDSNGNKVSYPNRVDYPSDAPSAVAVGGTVLQVGAGNSYQSESWWNTAPPGTFGSGGFGVSWHFGVPSYQRPYTSSATRSVPDVSADAGDGIAACVGTTNGVPNCASFVGTSVSAPLWAGIWALAVQAYTQAHPGILFFPSANGAALYSLAGNPNAFHPASSMTGTGNDFAHLGLGSPNITNLVSDLSGFPGVSSVSPKSGSVNGGYRVSISGNAFVGVQKVLFGGVPASSFSVTSETQLWVLVPKQTTWAGNTDVTVVTPAGSSPINSADAFYYCPPVLTVSPNIGSFAGGDLITVTGEFFNTQNNPNTTPFLFGGVPALNVNCSSSTQCTMRNPAHSAGTVPVQVAVTVGLPGSLDVGNYQFTYSPPAITRINPSIGGEVGGTLVDLYGVGFSPNMIVKFGATPSNSVYCRSNSYCTAQSPAGKGYVHITFTVGSQTSTATAADGYTYEPFPEIAYSSPAGGPGTGGTKVTVVGLNFLTAPGETTFMFGSSPATNVQCTSVNVCTMTSPAWNSSLDPGNEVEMSVTDTFSGQVGPKHFVNIWTSYGGILGPANGGWFTYPPPPQPNPICKGTTCQ